MAEDRQAADPLCIAPMQIAEVEPRRGTAQSTTARRELQVRHVPGDPVTESSLLPPVGRAVKLTALRTPYTHYDSILKRSERL